MGTNDLLLVPFLLLFVSSASASFLRSFGRPPPPGSKFFNTACLYSIHNPCLRNNTFLSLRNGCGVSKRRTVLSLSQHPKWQACISLCEGKQPHGSQCSPDCQLKRPKGCGCGCK